MTDGSPIEAQDELVYEGGGLPKRTNWWGAFVIGLAGTILVTGIAPVMGTALGAASIPLIVFTASSIFLLISVSISSGDAPGSETVTATVGTSTLGSRSTPSVK